MYSLLWREAKNHHHWHQAKGGSEGVLFSQKLVEF